MTDLPEGFVDEHGLYYKVGEGGLDCALLDDGKVTVGFYDETYLTFDNLIAAKAWIDAMYAADPTHERFNPKAS